MGVFSSLLSMTAQIASVMAGPRAGVIIEVGHTSRQVIKFGNEELLIVRPSNVVSFRTEHTWNALLFEKPAVGEKRDFMFCPSLGFWST